MSQNSQQITFNSAEGTPLAGRLDLPDPSSGPPKAYALWAHCFSCTKDIFAAGRVSKGLTDHGIAVLRFDFTGLGSSEGDFGNTNFSSNVDDLVAAADFLRANYAAPKLLIGHSLGGAAVLAVVDRIPEAEAVCTIGAPADPAHVAHHFTEARPEIEAKGEAEVLLAGRPFCIKKQFLDDIEGHKLEATIATMRKALLIFHSPIDATVGVDNAARIFAAAKHPKSFVSLDDADHLLSRKEDARYVANVIAAWAGRYVTHEGEEEKETAPLTPLTVQPETVVVAETGKGKFANAVSIGGRHSWLADEPESYGGSDTGPSPYEYLLAGLGACKSMTMRMYAERKGFALERVQVTLKHNKVHATDCENCETKDGHIDHIDVNIEIEGDLDDETREKIINIAEKCPVHRTLQSEVIIKSNH